MTQMLVPNVKIQVVEAKRLLGWLQDNKDHHNIY